jgi:hypothetical protein
LTFELELRDVVADADIFAGLAVFTEDGSDDGVDVVGGAVFLPVLDDAAEGLAATDRGPHLLEHLFGHVGVAGGVVREADQFFAFVLGYLRELFVDVQDRAFEVGLGHDTGEIGHVRADAEFGEFFGGGALGGEIRDNLDDTDGLTGAIVHDRGGHTGPDFMSGFGDEFAFDALRLTGGEILPIVAIGGRVLLRERDQHAVREAAKFVRRVAGEREKRRAGVEDVAVRVQLENGLGALESRELVAQGSEIGGGGFLFGDGGRACGGFGAGSGFARSHGGTGGGGSGLVHDRRREGWAAGGAGNLGGVGGGGGNLRGVEDVEEAFGEFMDPGDQISDGRREGVGGGFEGGIFDFDDVADAVDEEREESLVGAHDHEHRLVIGFTRRKSETAAKINRRDNLAAEIEEAFDVDGGERDARKLTGAQDFLHGEHVEAEEKVGDLKGAKLERCAHGGQAARLSPAPELRRRPGTSTKSVMRPCTMPRWARPGTSRISATRRRP